MNDRAQLFALWLLAASACMILIAKGRGLPPASGESAAFFLATSHGIRVKVSGIQGTSGIYRVPHGADVGTVINMALRGSAIVSGKLSGAEQRLKDGHWVAFEAATSEPARISLKIMSVQERILLGIPLEISSLTGAEWESLPGIGPALARKIEGDRQCNGAFRSVKDLERVPGIGKVTVKRLEPFF